jgi:hypothetical protein
MIADGQLGASLCYEPRTTRAETYADLIALISALNKDSSSRVDAFSKIANVDDILRNLALDMSLGGSDNLLNGKNYYLYKPTVSGGIIRREIFRIFISLSTLHFISKLKEWQVPHHFARL